MASSPSRRKGVKITDRKILIAVCSAVVVVVILLVMQAKESHLLAEPSEIPDAPGRDDQ